MTADLASRRRGRFLSSARAARSYRQHGHVQPFDRRELERSGWRTVLDYRENLVRGRDGRLEHLEVVWHAEAERIDRHGVTQVVAATASSAATVWSRLRAEADLVTVRARRSAGATS